MKISEKWVCAVVFSICLICGALSTSHGQEPKTWIGIGKDYDNALATARQRVNNIKARYTSFDQQLSIAQSKLNSLRKPAAVDNVKRLLIGEFETDEAFRQRVERTRTSDQQATTAALKSYELHKTAAQIAVDQVKKERGKQLPLLTGQLNKAKAAYTSAEQMPVWIDEIKVPNLQLPRFVRETMSFGPIEIKKLIAGGAANGFDEATQNAYRLQQDDRITLSLSSPSLNQAQIFKEGVTDGTITLTVSYRIKLREVERPFTVKHDVTVNEEEVDVGMIATKTVFGIISQALGGPAPPVYTPPKIVKRVVTKTKTYSGARYHYEIEPTSVRINNNKNGVDVTDVKLTNVKLSP